MKESTMVREAEVESVTWLPVAKAENVPARVSNEKEEYLKRLEKLGFTNVIKKMGLMEKMAKAYEKYLFVMPEAIQKFNENLRKETLREDKNAYSYKKLVFTRIEEYGKIPPLSVLEKMEAATKDGIFDRFEVAHIEWIKEVKDPIVFGRVEGCEDYFFVGQWDDDVKVEDLIMGK